MGGSGFILSSLNFLPLAIGYGRIIQHKNGLLLIGQKSIVLAFKGHRELEES